MNKVLFLSLILIATLFSAPKISAAEYYVPAEGQPASGLFVNKLVQNPQTNQFIDNLTVIDFHFLPENDVVFQIQVKNTGTVNLTNIVVKDVLPAEVTFISGLGNFDSNTKTLEFTIDSLNAGETKTFEVKAKVKPSNELPNNQVTCVANFAEVKVDSLSDLDTATFCIETQILGVTSELPKTGPASTVAILIGSVISLIASVMLFRKKSN